MEEGGQPRQEQDCFKVSQAKEFLRTRANAVSRIILPPVRGDSALSEGDLGSTGG